MLVEAHAVDLALGALLQLHPADHAVVVGVGIGAGQTGLPGPCGSTAMGGGEGHFLIGRRGQIDIVVAALGGHHAEEIGRAHV